jgi:AcrR family transcriptional regulator
MLNQTNTEQVILEAAEKLFIEKGYTGARTTEIAQAAGVNHAMLHYYFRTKENLFNRIFEQKAAQLLGFFVEAFNRECPFFEKLKTGIEMHFDFLIQQPELPLFVISEIIQDNGHKDLILPKILPTAREILKRINKTVGEEVNKGTIRPVKARNLLINIASLNVFSCVAIQLFFNIKKDRESAEYKNFLEERKRNNVEVIINSLKI